ncbi:MAG: 2-oxoacid:acceptor oxidoreductase family protein [Clostridia bacterium]|nr:2-oxoacid:acceptor oxidoreductase family protein [Clostridia bacterium]
MNYNVLFAGFGGQGILFQGKVMAYAGLIDGQEVSWLPSYGPEMRGGTANCSVCLSHEPIGSPLVVTPNAFVVLNGPSYNKFINEVEDGGVVVYESSLVPDIVEREGITQYGVDATRIAEENGLKGLGNIIMLGKLFSVLHFCDEQSLYKAVEKCVPPKKAHLIEANIKALKLGMTL